MIFKLNIGALVATISGLVWQDTSGGAQPAFYLDEIVFSAGPPPPAPTLTIDVAADRHPISDGIYGVSYGTRAMDSLLRRGRKVTAIVAGNDGIAYGAWRAIRRAGASVILTYFAKDAARIL